MCESQAAAARTVSQDETGSVANPAVTHRIVSRSEWLESRTALLAKEKAFTKLREQLSTEQRALP